jgi:hypothetical protein
MDGPCAIRRGTRSIVAQGHSARTRQADDAEVAAIEEGIKAVAKSQQALIDRLIYSVSMFIIPNKRLNTYQTSPIQHLRLLG